MEKKAGFFAQYVDFMVIMEGALAGTRVQVGGSGYDCQSVLGKHLG